MLIPKGQVSDLWLPIAACQLFEQAFGLTYDNTTNLYIVNASIHSQLQQLDPSVTFKIGISDFEGATVDINLPYGAFDLQASSPFYPDAMSYFPIRRAANSTQYILGRTFLQEAYLVVDYERSNFSVSQALFLNPCPQQLVAIHSVNHTSSNKTILTSIPTSHSTSRGVIAGAVVGAVLVIPLVIALAMFIRHYRGHRFRRPRATQRNTSELDAPGNGDEAKEDRVITPWILGIGGEEIPRNLQELGGRPWFRDQLEGTAVTAEMDHNLSEETNGSSSDHTPISPLREVRTGECTWATKGPHLNTLISPTNPCESTRNILHSRPSPLSPSSNGESTWRSFLSYQRPSLEIG